MGTIIRGIGLALFTLCVACGDDGDSADGEADRDSGDESPQDSGSGEPDSGGDEEDSAVAMPDEPCELDDGQCIFRHDTFGDEQLWTDVLRLHEVVETLTPTDALGVGLKVDATAVPAQTLASADLDDPATTVALLSLDAVVGVHAEIKDGAIERIGITCALCHSSVDDSVMPGIGERLDGWPNRDLNPGAIIALTPGLADYVEPLGVDVAAAKTALNSWGPGKYDARFNQDKMSNPVLIPPAYGLADVELETYTGEGPISYWNAYVAVTQMGGHGNFEDERLGIAIEQAPDRVTAKLPALRAYQFSIAAPAPPEGSYDEAAAMRGAEPFEEYCASCHAGESFSDAPMLHDASETGMEPLEAERSATGKYRSTPLKGLWQRAPYFHDGSAATLEDVVVHYDQELQLGMDAPERADLVEYLKSL